MKGLAKLKSYLTNKEIVKRLLFTLLALFIFRLLSKVPAPGINVDALQNLFGGASQNGFFNIANILAGGTLTQFSIISVGLFAFVNASIIFQLLGPVVPKIEQLQKMGEVGRKVINQWTRILTVPLAAFQSFGIYLLLKSQNLIETLPTFRIASLIFVLTAGSMLLIWLSELISEKGVGGKQGGGVTVIVTAGILASLPTSITQAFSSVTTSNFLKSFWSAFGVEWLLFIGLSLIVLAILFLGKVLLKQRSRPVRIINSLVFVIILLAIPTLLFVVTKSNATWAQDFRILWDTNYAKLSSVEIRFGFYLALSLQILALITFFNESYRKIPIKFISRIRTNANKSIDTISYLPIKLLSPGVMPIIFASSLLLLPQVIYRFFGEAISKKFVNAGEVLKYAAEGWLDQQISPYYYILHFILVVLFSLFFITIIMKPDDIGNDLKNRKTFIPGVRPGKETINYLSRVIMHITFWGGLVLAVISSLPFILGIYNTTVSSGIEAFIGGGTSILIVVPSILAIKTQLDALVLTKNYEQFEEI